VSESWQEIEVLRLFCHWPVWAAAARLVDIGRGVGRKALEEGQDMVALLVLAGFIVFIEVASIFGWVADSRDGRDWTPRNPVRGPRGPIRPPASWRS
jgi:hypothetical protein